MWRQRQWLKWGIYKPQDTSSYWQPAEAGRQAGDRCSFRTFKRNHLCQHLHFRLPASRTKREYISPLACAKSVVLVTAALGNQHPLHGDHWIYGEKWVSYFHFLLLLPLCPAVQSLSRKCPSLLAEAHISAPVLAFLLTLHHFSILSFIFILYSYCNFHLSLWVRSFYWPYSSARVHSSLLSVEVTLLAIYTCP